MDALSQLVTAWNVSTPLVSWQTADQPGAVNAISARFEAEQVDGQEDGPAILQHDLARGLRAVNTAGERALADIMPPAAETSEFSAVAPIPGKAPAEALQLVETLPDRAIVFFHNAQYLFTNMAVRQAVANAREACKTRGHCLIFAAPMLNLPAELVQDVMVIDDPLPTPAQLSERIGNVFEANDVTVTAEQLEQATDALRGIAMFPAEGAAAMSLAATGGIDLPILRERKKLIVTQTKGIVWMEPRVTFADVGGLASIERFGTQLMAGRNAPKAIAWCDELEKMLPNTTGATRSETGGDQLGVLLKAQEQNHWPGILNVGPPGSGKSLFAEALAGQYGLPLLQLDFGAAKGQGLVGQAEADIRELVRVLYAIAGESVLFVATCNRLDSVPAELKRRYKFGTWFFDLPTEDERAPIWAIHRRAQAIPEADPAPHDDEWTGSDIATCCELAYRLKLPLADAAEYIVPVAKADAEAIRTVRALANGKFKSANYAGTYQKNRGRDGSGRKVYPPTAIMPALPGPEDQKGS